jgi:integrase
MVLRQDQNTERKPNLGAGKTRPRRALTHRSIEALRPELAPYRVPDSKSSGLAIRVAPNGLLTWDLAFRLKAGNEGKRVFRRLSLGRFPEVSLDAARDRAGELTRAARAGRDLLASEQAAQAEASCRMTVGQLIDLYIKRRVAGRLKSARGVEHRLRRALAPMLGRHADEIRRRDMRQLLDDVADRDLKSEADKRRHTIGTMFRWAMSLDFVAIDPTAGLASYGVETSSDRVLSAEEIGKLWPWLASAGVPVDCRDVLRLELALGARCGEIAGMVADEIDSAKWLWTLPPERSKNGTARVTPLVGIARDILRSRLDVATQRLLFPTGTGKPSTSSHIGQMLLHRQTRLPIAGFTSHDLRRSAATMMVELGIALDVVAAIVGHEAGGRDTRTLVRHYVRTDLIERKRAALEIWDRHLLSIIEGEHQSNVTQIAAQKRAPVVGRCSVRTASKLAG